MLVPVPSGEIEAIAQDMVNKICSRRVCATHPRIENVFVAQDGNFTIVTLNGKFTGVAKFNPRDVITHEHVDKRGRWQEVQTSKYSAIAGLKKALHRAAEKMLNNQ